MEKKNYKQNKNNLDKSVNNKTSKSVNKNNIKDNIKKNDNSLKTANKSKVFGKSKLEKPLTKKDFSSKNEFENQKSTRAKIYSKSEHIGEEKKYKVTALYKVNKSCELMEFLLEKCKTSKNVVKSLLTKNKVLVNGSVVSQYNFLLVKDDEVKLSKTSINKGIISKAPKLAKNDRPKLPFKIIYQDDDFIAIDKPSGLLSIESDKDGESAYAYLLRFFTAKDKNSRPFLLHRIDKETSGVLVFAKNPIVYTTLKLHWNDYVKTREYYAIVEGKMEKQQGTYVSYLKENKNNIVYSTNETDGQKAITHYYVEKQGKEFALVKVNIDTGRKNQIRVHMQQLGHPIVGDYKYGYTLDPINRLGLHASKLEIVNPRTKQLVSISAPVPENFKKVI